MEQESKLAAQRAQLEMAKERERQLQLELEGMDEESFELEKAAIGGVSLKGSGLGLGGIRDKENLPL